MSREYQGTTCAIGSRNLHHSVMPTAPTKRAALSSRSNSSTSGLGSLSEGIYLDIYCQMGLAEPCLHLGIYFFAMPGSQKMISRVSWPVSRDPGLQEGILEWRCDWNKKSNQPISQPTHKPSNAPTNQRTDQSIYQSIYLTLPYLTLPYLILSYLIVSYRILSIYLSINHSTKIVFHIAKISHPKSTIFQRA